MHDAEYWKRRCALEPHPEGGFFREIYRSSDKIAGAHCPRPRAGDRNLITQILYLLVAPGVSALHRLLSAETWAFLEGDPLTLHVIEPGGRCVSCVLGRDPDAGESLTAAVEPGCWFGASLENAGSYALVSCTVAPGFDVRDFEIGDRENLLALFPQHAALIDRLNAGR